MGKVGNIMANTVMDGFQYLLRLIEMIILVRVLLSWVPMSRENPFAKIVYNLSEPILGPIRIVLEKVLPRKIAFFDFSPIVAFLAIKLLSGFITSRMSYF